MDVHLTKCCFCVPLKAGVVIISSLWLIYGIFQSVSNALYITSPNQGTNVFRYIIPCTLSMVIFYGLITIGALFGLFVVTFTNTYRMLSIYSKVANCIVGIDIISHFVTIVVIVLYRSTILEKCLGPGSITSTRIDACDGEYTSVLTLSIAVTVISVLSSVYFAIVISAYAHKRKKKEAPEEDDLDDL
ncbi:hypothetical protein C1645_764361 [Glomus cerebriforme]|uniref:MARVEL domain-containing protein n=1 Tax=Glomus cerebriforme TaxID=658196 RepID=A0A397TCS2_9GLOM|nr:hypothetical protein C1645_764361 [Glomus cerebriforme]